MSDDNYSAVNANPYLDERGARYKRNVIVVSAAAIAAIKVPGIRIDPNDAAFVEGLSGQWLWTVVFVLLSYNFLLAAVSMRQGASAFAAETFAYHRSYLRTFLFGTDQKYYGKQRLGDIVKMPGHPDPPVKRVAKMEGSETGYNVVVYPVGRNGEPADTGTKGKTIDGSSLRHLRGRFWIFVGADILFPCLLIGFAAPLILAEIASAKGSQDITITDGDTIRIGEERIRIRGLDTPETFRPECLAEAMLGAKATERLDALLAAGEVTIKREGPYKYGRTRATVSVDGDDVAPLMIAEGLAFKRRPKEGWCHAKQQRRN